MNIRQVGGVLMLLGLAAAIPIAIWLGIVTALITAMVSVVVGAGLALRD